MILKKGIVTNFRGIKCSININFDLFNRIVGQNDAVSQRYEKELDASLDEATLSRDLLPSCYYKRTTYGTNLQKRHSLSLIF